jgi:hypothetical protein
VHLRIAPVLELIVRNGPTATVARPVGNGGHGIAGMQARALAVGGEVTAGPSADGGFEVHAKLPMSQGVPLDAAVGRSSR